MNNRIQELKLQAGIQDNPDQEGLDLFADLIVQEFSNQVKTVDRIIILLYNLTLLVGASYLVYYRDASAWLFALALCFGASWKEKDKQ